MTDTTHFLSDSLPTLFTYQEGDESPAQELCFVCAKKGIQTPIQTTQGLLRQFPPNSTCCPDCIEQIDYGRNIKELAGRWKLLCPPEYQDTNTKNPDFNRASFLEVKKRNISSSLFFYGTSGACKTRVMMLRAKSSMIKGRSVCILFPEDIKEYARSRDRLAGLKHLTRFDFLGLDDLFAAGMATDAVSDFIKDLLDRRIRHKMATIITTQLSVAEFRGESQKWKNYTSAETKRLDAIFRRIKEKFVPILFDNPQDQDQLPF